MIAGLLVFPAGAAWSFTESTATYSNDFFGYNAGTSTTGHFNSFFGRNAGKLNTTGANNSFFGADAGSSNETGINNSFVGGAAGIYNTTGERNVFIGRGTGQNNTEGSFNSYLGTYAGLMNTIGSGNIFLGYKAGYSETGSNKLYISNSDTDLPLIYGEFDNQYLEINGTLTASLVSLSDVRFKKDIKPLKSSLEKVSSLEGVSYSWKTEKYKGKGFQEGRQIGLIAQDVEKVVPELVYTDSKGYKAVAYDKLVPVLVEAMKEQQKMIEEERTARQKLQKTVDEQQTIIGELQTALQFKQDKKADVAQTE